jgi:4-amino-4-deoxy-L-arabinose transferase-like glycosyltransferase
MIRNYVWKANPIYPLYHNLINPQRSISIDTLEDNSKARGSDAEPQQISTKKSTPWHSFAIRKVIFGEAWWEIALIPVRIFFQGQDDNPKYFDGKLSPFLFFLPFFAFFQLKNNPTSLRTEKTIFAFFTILCILYAFFQTDMRIRYIAPIIPPLVILSVFGLYKLKSAVILPGSGLPKRLWVGSVFVIALVMLGLNAVYIKKQFDIVIPFSYLSGRMDRDAYIAKYRPEYMTIQYANRNLPNNAKVLALFLGNRLYYNDRDLIFGNNLFRKSVKTSESSDMILAEMQKIGFTHLLIRYDPFNRWAGVQFNEKEKEMIKAIFKKNLKQLFSQSGCGLFRITTGR